MEQKKKILIPTDFSVLALNTVREAIDLSMEKPLEIVLLHGVSLPGSITDLLFYSKSRVIEEMETPEFSDACKLLISKYQSRIHSMYVDVITSRNRSNFNSYLESNGIEEIYIPSSYALKLSSKRSFDILPLIEKCKVKVTKLEWRKKVTKPVPETNHVADLFIAE